MEVARPSYEQQHLEQQLLDLRVAVVRWTKSENLESQAGHTLQVLHMTVQRAVVVPRTCDLSASHEAKFKTKFPERVMMDNQPI